MATLLPWTLSHRLDCERGYQRPLDTLATASTGYACNMCLKLISVPIDKFGGKTMARCRRCKECISERKMKWIGRMLAAEQTAKNTLFATFTYAGGYDAINAYHLDYRDLQNCLKLMRYGSKRKGIDPLEFGYVAVGEYGGEKNRAHFHALFFFDGDGPDLELDKRVDYFAWKWGKVQFEKPRSKQGAATYLMDYLDKDGFDINRLKYSKRPALGHTYMLKYAEDHAKAGLGLFQGGPSFTIPNNTARSGKPFFYRIEPDEPIYSHMITRYVSTWIATRPDRPMPLNTAMEEIIDELCEAIHCPPEWHEYFARFYGWQPLYGLNPTYVQGSGNLQITRYSEHYRLEIFNQYGAQIWHGDLLLHEANDLLGVPRGPFNESLFPRLEQLWLKQAPQYVQKYLQSLPNG
ncbi:replication initiator protein [Microviridae sp.]|nr:replication initiator protein [Microviridae sp.]